jgi:hypothetical protein
MAKPKLPPEVAEFFREQGRRGGKKSAKTLSPEERVARARKASTAAKKAIARLTPEERRARALKAVAARVGKRSKTKRKP